jgi:hypothetical protein
MTLGSRGGLSRLTPWPVITRMAGGGSRRMIGGHDEET